MADPFFLPIRDPQEVYALIDELPLAVDRDHFARFVLGFPRHYLVNTSRTEIVKHYLLAETLGAHKVISSISREGDFWKLIIIALDRSRLFSRISGSLSCFGANIAFAEAFANASSLVLDSFRFVDTEGRFDSDRERDRFQHFLEDVVEGKEKLGPRLKSRWPQLLLHQPEPFQVKIDNQSHPSATKVALRCGDHFGLLYLISSAISKAGCSIDAAYIETIGGTAQDEFYVTLEGAKLDGARQEALRSNLQALGEHVLLQPDEAAGLLD